MNGKELFEYFQNRRNPVNRLTESSKKFAFVESVLKNTEVLET